MVFCNYYSGYVRMYAELSGPLHKMLQVGKFDGRKGSKKKLAWTPEAEDAFTRLKEGLAQLALHNPHIWANSLKPVCFLCFLLFWCPLLPVIETGTLKIYTKMVLYMKNEFLTSNTPSWGLNPHSTNLRVAFYL